MGGLAAARTGVLAALVVLALTLIGCTGFRSRCMSRFGRRALVPSLAAGAARSKTSAAAGAATAVGVEAKVGRGGRKGSKVSAEEVGEGDAATTTLSEFDAAPASSKKKKVLKDIVVVRERELVVLEPTAKELELRRKAKIAVESDAEGRKRAAVLFAFSQDDAQAMDRFIDKKDKLWKDMTEKLANDRKEHLEALEYGKLSAKGKRDYLARAESEEDDDEDDEDAGQSASLSLSPLSLSPSLSSSPLLSSFSLPPLSSLISLSPSLSSSLLRFCRSSFSPTH